ncbi:MAG: glycosyltransferase family 4 protein [Thermodesulfobacteriota bacterium]
MKIILLNTLYYPNQVGGAERSVRLLAEGLVAFGHEVAVICIAPKASVKTINGVKVYYIKPRNIYWPIHGDRHWVFKGIWHAIDLLNIFMARSVGLILAKEKPDVVNTNNLAGFSIMAWRESKKRGIRLIHTIRDYYLLCPQGTMFRNGSNCKQPCTSCKVFSMPKAPFSGLVDHVVGISQFVLDRHLQQGFFKKTRKSIIPNINSFEFLSQVSAHPKRVRFGYIGWIDSRKGIELLLDTFINSNICKVSTLIIAGTGSPDYLSTLKQIYTSSYLEYLGVVDPEDFYNKVDVVVVPSLWHEPLGRAILEAYAYGFPVIAANRGGIPEIISEGKTGFLFDPDDKNGLLRCLEKFTSDRTLSSRMSAACFDEAKRFSTEEIVNKYVGIYKNDDFDL